MERIYFEKYHLDRDILDYFSLVLNEEVMNMNFGRVFTMEEAKRSFKKVLETNNKNEELGYFKVYDLITKRVIGLGGIIPNEDTEEAEVEYLLLPEYWGLGYGSEVLSELLKLASKNKFIKKIVAITDPKNIASIKILVNKGFKSEKIYKVEDGSLAERFIKRV